MGVYIKDVNKPKSCENCMFVTDYYGIDKCMFKDVHSYNDCPLIDFNIGIIGVDLSPEKGD